MDYEKYVKDLCSTAEGRLYLFALIATLEADDDLKSLAYLRACVLMAGETEENNCISDKIQDCIDKKITKK